MRSGLSDCYRRYFIRLAADTPRPAADRPGSQPAHALRSAGPRRPIGGSDRRLVAFA